MESSLKQQSNIDKDQHCGYCNHHFDKMQRIPRVLPNCGHSICDKCLNAFIVHASLNKNFTLECVEDKCEDNNA